VRATLPALDERAAGAFALVALAGRTRPEAALRLQVSQEDLASDLAAARTALRRSVGPLRGSGWCMRAERLVSDRLDGELGGTEEARLDAHLRNCARCVEHERRLVQATDSLLGASPAPVAAVEHAPTILPVAPAQPQAAPARRASRTGRELARATTWNVLLVIAVLVTLAAIALALAGVLGAKL
jgi:hypothetical protein